MDSIIGAMVLAFILSLFNCEEIFPKAVNEAFGTHLTSNSYWFGFFVIGVIIAIVKR